MIVLFKHLFVNKRKISEESDLTKRITTVMTVAVAAKVTKETQIINKF